MEKQNDYFLNLMTNPTFGPQDFSLVGLSADNTSLLDKKVYENIEEIRNQSIFLTNGVFDLAKFDAAYNVAKAGYNNLTNMKAAEDYLDTWSFYRGDITAPEELRNNLPEFLIKKIANPLRQQLGFVTPGLMEAPTQSVREIAEAQKGFDNGKWVKSPNESWLENFYKPKALALWDEDGTHIDPITGETVEHIKGEKKLNANGTYYYETLNGKSPYGREVLSAFDTLTVDGSAMNKVDFLDSDDLDKSTFGSLARSVVQIAPAFIQGVGEWYIGSRVLLSLSEVLPTVGKIFTGSDNKALSYLEGLNKSLSFSTSDYTQGSQEAEIEGSAWTMETGLKLIADVFTQLAEQRFVFKYGTAMLSGLKPKEIVNPKAQLKWIEKYVAENSNNEKLFKALNDLDPFEREATAQSINYALAKNLFMSKMERALKLGSKLSMAYMTGITTAGAYGEAKENGASDIEAALFTLGYTAGEYALLRSDLGQWILPELKTEKKHWQAIVKTLNGITKESERSNYWDKLKWYLKLYDFGKQVYHNDLSESVLGEAVGGVVSNMLSEGIEETAEELLADLSKSLYTAAFQLTGSKTDLHGFENVFDRYAMSFIGGGIGGAIAGALPEFRAAKENHKIDSKLAAKHLVDIVQQGKAEEFLKTAYKMNISNKYQSSEIDEQGNHKEGTSSNNRDLDAKKRLTDLVYNIKDILEANGADMSRNEVVDSLKRDLRYSQLITIAEKDDDMISYYLGKYNELSERLVELTTDIYNLEHPIKTDKQKREEKKEGEETQQEKDISNQIEEKKKELQKIKDLLDMYKDGRASDEFVLDILFKMITDISSHYIATDFERWAEEQEGINFLEISQDRIDVLTREFVEKTKNNPMHRELVHLARLVHIKNQEVLSDVISKYGEKYFKEGNSVLGKNLDSVLNILNNQINKNPSKSIELSELFAHIYENLPNPLLARFLNIFLNSLSDKKLEEYVKLLKDLAEQNNSLLKVLKRNVPTFSEIKEMLNNPETSNEALEILTKMRLSSYENFNLTAEEILNDEDAEKIYNEQINDANNYFQERATLEWNNYLYNFLSDPEVEKEIIKALNNTKYLLPETKQALLDFFNASIPIESFDSLSGVNYLLIKNRKKYIEAVNKKPSSPVNEILENVVTTLKGKGVQISLMTGELSELLSKLALDLNVESFLYSKETEDKINEALKIIELTLVALESAKTSVVGGLGDLFGFNVTVNEIREKRGKEKFKKLATLDSETIASISDDIFKQLETLKKFVTIYSYNTDSQLKSHDLALKIESYILYNRLNTFIGHVSLDDWEGIKELRKELEHSDIKEIFDKIKEDGENFVLNLENKKKISEASIKLENAVHNFFVKNKEKLLKIEDVQKLLSSLNPIKNDTEELNLSSKRIPDSDFVWYLAYLASENPESVLHEYKECITKNFAPVIGLEQAIKTTYAFLLHQKLFEIFAEAYNKNNKEKFSEQDFPYLEINAFRSLFIEGCPGSGKSSATLTMVLRMLNKYHTDFLKELVIVSMTKENADKLLDDLRRSTGLELKEVQTFSKEEYFKKISNNYHLEFDSYGNVVLTKEDVANDEYKNITINPDGLKASLVIVDEATSLSELDARLEDKWLKEKGILSIKAGDFDQLGVYGEYQAEDGKRTLVELVGLNYIRTLKLGQIIRSENKHKEGNILTFKKSFPELVTFLTSEQIEEVVATLHYYMDNTGLYGDVIDRAEDDGEVSKETKDKIKLMFDTLKDGEKINVIYDDTNSSLYQYLESLKTSDQYKNKIEFVTSGASLGLEGQYYIVDLNLEKSSEHGEAVIHKAKREISTLYTAISRAKLGTLIFDRRKADENSAIYDALESKRINKLIKSNLSSQSVENYGKERQKILDSILAKYVPTTTDKKKENKKLKPNPEPIKNVPVSDNEDNKEVDLSNHEKPRIFERIESKEGEMNMILHSTMVQETGCEVSDITKDASDPNNTLILADPSYKRIDGINGLVKIGIIKPVNGSEIKGTEKEKALNILGEIRSAAIYEKDKASIEDRIAKSLTESGKTSPEIKIKFIYKNSNVAQEKPSKPGSKYNKFFKSVKEFLLGIFNKEKKGTLVVPKNQTIGIEVYIKDKEGNWNLSLEVPLVMLTSPLTMLTTPSYQVLRNIFDTQFSNKKDSIRDFMSWMQTEIVNGNPNKIPHLKSMWKLCRLYIDSSNFIVRLDDDFTLNRRDNLTGIIHANLRGEEYYFSHEYDYNGTPVSLEEYRKQMLWRKISKILVWTGTEDLQASDNHIIAKKGDPFVLVSDNPEHKSMDDNELMSAFLEQENDETKPLYIKRMYLYSPEGSISDYLFTILQLFNAVKDENVGTDELDVNLGNKLSSYRILKAAAKDGTKFDSVITKWLESEKTETSNGEIGFSKESSLNRWKWLKEFINVISEYEKDNPGIKILDVLNKSFEELESGQIKSKIAELLNMKTNGKVNEAIPTKTPIRTVLQYELRKLIFSTIGFGPAIHGQLNVAKIEKQTGGYEFEAYLKERIKALEESCKENGLKKILFHPTLNKSDDDILATYKENTIRFATVTSEQNTYISGKSFKINSKLETTGVILDVEPLLDKILGIQNGIINFISLSSENEIKLHYLGNVHKTDTDNYLDGIIDEIKGDNNLLKFNTNITNKLTFDTGFNIDIKKRILNSIKISENPDTPIPTDVNDSNSVLNYILKCLRDNGINAIPIRHGEKYYIKYFEEEITDQEILSDGSVLFILEGKVFIAKPGNTEAFSINDKSEVELNDLKEKVNKGGQESLIQSKNTENIDDKINRVLKVINEYLEKGEQVTFTDVDDLKTYLKENSTRDREKILKDILGNSVNDVDFNKIKDEIITTFDSYLKNDNNEQSCSVPAN